MKIAAISHLLHWTGKAEAHYILIMPKPPINPAEALEREFAQERASALGRLGRAFEAALAALAEFDQTPCATIERQQMRPALVAEASMALWRFIVQREACGLRDMRQVLRDYAVPAEVAARMGALPLSSARLRTRKSP